MKPAPFKYYAPTTLEASLTLVTEHGYDAKLLAGGQSLIPTMNFRLAEPSIIVDLNCVSELDYIRETRSGGLNIGAMTRQRSLERSDLVAKHSPLIYETMPFIAHPQIRNRGTVGGSIAHADPAAEFPAIFTALDAKFRLQNKNGDRWVPIRDFYLGMFATEMADEEILVEIEIPAMPKRSGYAFTEVARRHGDYAIVGVAAVISVDRKGRCQDCKLVFLSVGDGPVEALQAADVLKGESFSPEVVKAAAHAAAHKDIDPGDDLHASAAYRRHLANNLSIQVLTTAFQRAVNK